MAGRHRTKPKRRLFPWLVGLAVLTAVPGAGWGIASLASESTEGDSNCATPFVISSVSSMAGVMQDAAKAVATEQGCPAATVKVTQPADVEAELDRGACVDLWVPDSLARVKGLQTALINPQPLGESLARTPVGLVSGPAAEAPASWADALNSGFTVLTDPAADVASAAVLLGPLSERKQTGASATEAEAALVGVAQKVGEQIASDSGPSVTVDKVRPTTSALIPITEQDYLTARVKNADLTLATPDTGNLELSFPLVTCVDAPDQVLKTGRAIVKWLDSAAGKKTLAEHGLRDRTGAPIANRGGFGDVDVLPHPDARESRTLLNAWRVLSVPSSLIAVYDVSGSMDFMAGDKSRIRLAKEAASTALNAFPSTARIGMWAFSIDQGGPGQDYTIMAPPRILQEKVEGGGTHEDLLRRKLDELESMTRGGTGLYDTAWAAYQYAKKHYDDRFFNVVVLLTDGANDDPGSITLDQLLANLRRAQDPSRPIRIISVGISRDADMSALQMLSRATGGEAYAAEDPRQILDVLASGLMGR